MLYKHFPRIDKVNVRELTVSFNNNVHSVVECCFLNANCQRRSQYEAFEAVASLKIPNDKLK